uniref:RGS domain-containing protein n=1 Tax=Heterorhabditis bacteriophora TaxID=37862 RepID=A0A1I7XUN6_HETBA
MRMDNHDWHSSIRGYSSSASDVRMLVNSHHLDYTTASSSTNNSHEYCRMHRATLPSITTTSENTSNFDDLNTVSPLEPRKIDYHRLYADPNQNEGKSISSPKVELSVRRAASFTFSPKGTVDKHNKRLQHVCSKEEEHKKKFFGPISKTLSYLRNKIASTSSLYIPKDEVRLWETSFDALLSHKCMSNYFYLIGSCIHKSKHMNLDGCDLFRQFLKKEFSSENLEFWLECEEFKKMKDGKKATTQKAHEIFKEFVSERSVREVRFVYYLPVQPTDLHIRFQVNLDSDTRAATKAALENGCQTDTFSLAQSRIQQLMEKDTYRRFLKDRLYLDLLDSYEVPEHFGKTGER